MSETIDDNPTLDEAPARRLVRTDDGRWLGGVAAGLGRYFDINPLVYRIAFAALALAGGTGLLLYLAAWLVIPDEEREESIAVEALRDAPRPALASARRRPAVLRRAASRSPRRASGPAPGNVWLARDPRRSRARLVACVRTATAPPSRTSAPRARPTRPPPRRRSADRRGPARRAAKAVALRAGRSARSSPRPASSACSRCSTSTTSTSRSRSPPASSIVGGAVAVGAMTGAASAGSSSSGSSCWPASASPRRRPSRSRRASATGRAAARRRRAASELRARHRRARPSTSARSTLPPAPRRSKPASAIGELVVTVPRGRRASRSTRTRASARSTSSASATTASTSTRRSLPGLDAGCAACSSSRPTSASASIEVRRG